jgi:hypothetical protein
MATALANVAASSDAVSALPATKMPGRRPGIWHLGATLCCGAPPGAVQRSPYLILVSRNSTCFFATGSYFFFTIFSV